MTPFWRRMRTSAFVAGVIVVGGYGLRATQPGPLAGAQSMTVSPAAGPIGATGGTGATGATGATGTAGVNAFGAPTTRTLSLATAYQATTTTKPAIVTVNLTSTASFSLTGGSTNTADILIGSTSGVATGTGTIMCKYGNSSTAGVAVGVGVTGIQGSTCTLALPTGWFFAIRQTAGTVTIVSSFDASVG